MTASVGSSGTRLSGGRRVPELPQLSDAERARKQVTWPLSEARRLLRDGYSLACVMEKTGQPLALLDDLVGSDDPHFNEAWHSRNRNRRIPDLSS